MNILKKVFAVAMILPLFVIPRLTGEMTLKGYETWEAISLSFGITLPFVLVFMLGYFLVDRKLRKSTD